MKRVVALRVCLYICYILIMISPDHIRPFLANTIAKTDFQGLGERYRGKVRDVYTTGDQVILVSTDRQSAFDEQWCTIPLKGQALNQISAWWFDQVKDVMSTHVIAVPDPNITVAKKLKMVKVEVVVRAYLTGSTSTSAWVNYEKGIRNFCGNSLPEGMIKNQRLEEIIFTPSTKPETGHDVSASPEELIEMGVTTPEEIRKLKEHAFALFKRGQDIALKRGLILVDTKYEMGYDSDGVLRVGDEVHTPDSSRYWIADSYQERFNRGEEPESLDKEFFRLWLKEQGFVDGEKRPEVTDDARVMLAQRYIDLYERVTGETFEIEEGNVLKRMERNVEEYRVGVNV
jgi:phosphoribosylaminoimidazole-succinocarboxamide synthase